MGDVVGTKAAHPKRSWAERRLTVLYETAHALASSATLSEGVPRTLAAVCQALDWEYGALWNVDRPANLLRCVATWSLPSLSFETFVEASRGASFAPGIGLPGRVWASGAPAWIPDVLQDANFPRAKAAARDGLRAAFGFPLEMDGEIRGVMEFFSRQFRPPDPALLELLGAVGSQIGLFMAQRQAQERLDQFFTLSRDLFCIASSDGVNGHLSRHGYTRVHEDAAGERFVAGRLQRDVRGLSRHAGADALLISAISKLNQALLV